MGGGKSDVRPEIMTFYQRFVTRNGRACHDLQYTREQIDNCADQPGCTLPTIEITNDLKHAIHDEVKEGLQREYPGRDYGVGDLASLWSQRVRDAEDEFNRLCNMPSRILAINFAPTDFQSAVLRRVMTSDPTGNDNDDSLHVGITRVAEDLKAGRIRFKKPLPHTAATEIFNALAFEAPRNIFATLKLIPARMLCTTSPSCADEIRKIQIQQLYEWLTLSPDYVEYPPSQKK